MLPEQPSDRQFEYSYEACSNCGAVRDNADAVPRSRYDACNKDWIDAKSKLKEVQDIASKELADKDKQIAALTEEVKNGMVQALQNEGLRKQIAELQMTIAQERTTILELEKEIEELSQRSHDWQGRVYEKNKEIEILKRMIK